MTLASLQSQAEDEAIRTHIESINSFINGKHIIAWYTNEAPHFTLRNDILFNSAILLVVWSM